MSCFQPGRECGAGFDLRPVLQFVRLGGTRPHQARSTGVGLLAITGFRRRHSFRPISSSSQASLQRRRELFLRPYRCAIRLRSASQNRQQALSSQTLALFGDTLRWLQCHPTEIVVGHWGFKLSPTSNVNAIAFRSNTTGNSTAGGNLHTKVAGVNFSTRVAAKTTASLGLRHTVSDSDTSPYTENVLTGTLTHQF